MGNSQPEPPPSPPLTERPWRVTRGWSGEVRRELKESVIDLAPEMPSDEMQIPFFNILLTGQAKAGKSSFYNSLNSVLRQKVFPGTQAGVKAYSLTNDYRVYEMRLSPRTQPLSFRICDTMGLDHEMQSELDVRNILKAVDGHVPNGFVFHRNREIVPDSPRYINIPILQDKAHCVAVVIDGSKADVMEPNMCRKLQSLRSGLIDRKIPTFILLTHIDQACPEVNRDVTKVYHSKDIQRLVNKVGRRLHGLPENQIFPIINNIKQVELDDSKDILLLTALRQMLYAAQGYLENRM